MKKAAAATTFLLTAMALVFPGFSAPSGASQSSGAASAVLCVHAQAKSGETPESAIAKLETKIGRKIAAHKDFFKWDDQFPTSQQVDDAKNGRAPAINWIAQMRGGGVVLWRDIAAGKQDARIRDMAGDIKAFGKHVYLTFHHEPENDGDNGTAAEFIDAFRHTRSVFEKQGASNVTWVVALMAMTFNEGDPNKWYPGDAYVDLVGLNGYNWYPGKPGSTWRTLSEIFQKAYKWAAARPKPVMITETGVQEDPEWTTGNRKAQWFLDALATLKNWPLVKVFCYWHSRISYPWWVDTSAASLDAFRKIANDPYMGGSGTSSPSGDSTPPTVKAPTQALIQNSTLGTSAVPVKVSWSGSDGGSGISRYELQQSTDGGVTYTGVALPSAKATSITRSLSPGTNLYRFRVRAVDGAGNWSAWAEGPAFKVIAHQESSLSISYSGNWHTAKQTSAYGGALRWTKVRGDKATLSWSGSSIAWVSPKASNLGKAEVWLDGSKAATVDLYSSTSLSRRAVFVRTFGSSSLHKLEVRVLGARNASSKGNEVDVDAFIVLTSSGVGGT